MVSRSYAFVPVFLQERRLFYCLKKPAPCNSVPLLGNRKFREFSIEEEETMPIKVNDHLSAIVQLQEEGIFTMTEQRANNQRVRPLKVCILNLMPLKKPTEIQLLRLLGNSPPAD